MSIVIKVPLNSDQDILLSSNNESQYAVNAVESIIYADKEDINSLYIFDLAKQPKDIVKAFLKKCKENPYNSIELNINDLIIETRINNTSLVCKD